MQPIPAQVPIIDAVKQGKTISVDAVPGGGKSTILKMIDNILQKDTFLALMFSSALASELITQFQYGSVSTLHAHGLKACSTFLKLKEIKKQAKKLPNGQIVRSHVHEELTEQAIFQYLKQEFGLIREIPKLLYIQGENIPFNIALQEIKQVVEKIALNAIHYTDCTKIHRLFDAQFGMEFVGHGINVLTKIVNHYFLLRGQVDFLGMLYLPVIIPEVQRHIIKPEILAIDESQDSNPLMQAMYGLIAQQAKQVILLGDSNQTIHIWNNTSPAALKQLSRHFNAVSISYSVSFRLPEAITAYLRTSGLDRNIVSWSKKPGSLQSISLNKAMMKELRNGDWVLGRFNRHKAKSVLSLEKFSIDLLTLGKTVRLLGSEYIEICKSCLFKLHDKPENKVVELDRIIKAEVAEIEKTKGPNHHKARRLAYELEVFTLYYNFYLSKRSQLDFIQFLETIYADDEKSITLCTYHRSKGKEAKRIFLLHVDIIYADIVNTEIPIAKRIEARNLLYVGITRTLEDLFIIDATLPESYPTLEFIETVDKT